MLVYTDSRFFYLQEIFMKPSRHFWRSLFGALVLFGMGEQNIMAQYSTQGASSNTMYHQINEIKLLGNLSIKQYELNNGLQVAIVVDKTTPIFTYQTWFKTGSADEPANHQGLAHLFEHMMFRKTSKRDMGEFDRLVNANGGTGLNAYTSRDQTVYFFTFPNDKLELAADLESDRMVDLVIDSTMFETEKGAVLTEKNRGLDDPTRYLWDEVYKLAYTKHNYKYSTIGEIESIKSFTVQEARDFYTNYYAPNNALIIVVGDVDLDNVMTTIVKHYGVLQPHNAKKRDVTTEPQQLEERSTVLTHPKATQSMLAKVWHIPNMLDSDYPALAMVGRLLTSGKTAILTELLVNKAKVTDLASEAYVSKDLGTFEFFVQLADGITFDEVEQIFHDAVKELAEGKISDDQIQIVKNNLLKEIYRSSTSPSSLAQKLGDGFINTNDMSFQIKVTDRIESVTKEDIRRVITKYILDGKATTVKLNPEKKS
jgi:zinc protease